MPSSTLVSQARFSRWGGGGGGVGWGEERVWSRSYRLVVFSHSAEFREATVMQWEEDTLPFIHLTTIAGVDISFHKAHPDHACAMLTVLKFPQLKVYCSMYMYRARTRATSYLHSLLVCVCVCAWMCVCVCVCPGGS